VSTNGQWDCAARPSVSSSKLNRVSSVRFIYVALNAPLGMKLYRIASRRRKSLSIFSTHVAIRLCLQISAIFCPL